MKHREADSSLILRHYLHAHPDIPSAYEMKDSRGKDSIPFDCLEPNQIIYGQAIKSDKGVMIRVQGVNGEPDYIYLRKFPSRIAIKYPKSIALVDVETFIMEKKRSKRKSLTEKRANEIAIKTIKL